MKIFAVVAHYDIDEALDANFRVLLSALEEVCEHIVIVSTSFLPDSEMPNGHKTTIILRPNIGYDFYSYRVGLDEIERRGGASRIFIVNSSFFILNKEKFVTALKDMLHQDDAATVGITSSYQISLHLQSYLLLIGKNVHQSSWFKSFITSIQPQNSKYEIIVHYEIGLSRLLLENHIKLVQLFRPSLLATLHASVNWMVKLVEMYGFNGVLKGIPLKHFREVNWVHFGANKIASQFGFVKSEVVRTNPLNMNLGFIEKKSDPCLLNSMKETLKRTSSNYQTSDDGLSKLVLQKFPLCKVQSGRVARPGVQVAVVVHLFYVDLLEEIYAELGNIIEPFDIFVTTPFEGAIPSIIDTFSSRAQSVTVFLIENRGRDIGPFILLYRTGILDPYTAVLKLHTKRSKYNSNGDFWRQEIYRGVLGRSRLTNNIIKLLEQPNIGMVGIEKYYLSHEKYWGADKENASKLLIEMDVLKAGEEQQLGFFAGSMFWFKPLAFEPLKLISYDHLLFDLENGLQDGTLAHAVERIFCNVARHQGFIVTSPTLAGDDINSVDTANNLVPVL
ncbi:rhamnan synthesis F family protein [Alphaproteobacteria bacterium]|nr:rhamnan synthesis F family protein [Alphaproteobacteria bacterium]